MTPSPALAALLAGLPALATEPAANLAAPAAPALSAAGLSGSLWSYLAISGVLFLLGIATILTRRNALYVLMGTELILNAANINFVAFARFGDFGIDGQMMGLVVVMLAAAEAAVALAIVLRVFHDFGSIDITRTDSLRD